MAFCAITDNDKLNLVKITNHILNRNIDSLSDFKTLSKTAYQIMITKNATPEKAATLVSFLPESVVGWRDRKSEAGDPIDKKYKDLISQIVDFSKKNLTDYNSILKFLDIAPQVQKETKKLKSGVQEVFDSNPELANIGTLEQYSAYLDTVFPNSKFKNIFYHGLPFIENKEDYFRDNTETEELFGNEANIRLWNFFFLSRDRARDYGDEQYAVILNFSADYNSPEFSYKASPAYKTADSAIVIAQGGDEFVVKNKKQIHILGNKQDIEGFKKFVTGNKVDIVPVLDNQDATLSEVDKFQSEIKVEFVEEKDENGNIINRRKINGVVYDTRVTDISVIGYYDLSEQETDQQNSPSLKHGNTIDRIAKAIFSGDDIQFSEVEGGISSISENNFNSLKQHFLKVKNEYEQKGFKFKTAVTVYDPATKISGEIDLVLVDKEGKMYIADTKTTFGKYTQGALTKDTSFLGKRKIKKLSKESNYSTQMYVYSLLLNKTFPGKVDTKNFTVIGIGIGYDTQLFADESSIDEIINVDTFSINKVRPEFANKSLEEISREFSSMRKSNYQIPINEVVEDSISEPITLEEKIIDLYERATIDRTLGKYEYSKRSNTIFFNRSVAFTNNDIVNQGKSSVDPIRSLVLKHIEKRKQTEKDNAENIRVQKVKESLLNYRGNPIEQKQKEQEAKKEYENTIKEIDERYAKEIEEIGKPVDTTSLFRPKRKALDRIKIINELAASSQEMQAEIYWLISTFGEKIVLKVFDAVNSELNGQVFLNIVKLWKNASTGTGYHEGWHVFSQLFLTIEEKVKLYNSIKKSGTPITVRRVGKVETINSKDATYLEIEEFLADEFAKYGLNPESYNFKKLFKKESETPQNIFQKLWNALKRLFEFVTGRDGNYSRRKIEIYFNDLKIGKLSNYSYSLKNSMFQGALNSITGSVSKQKEIISPERMPLYAESIDTLIRRELSSAGRVFTSFNTDAKLRRAVFNNIYIELLDRYEGKGQPLSDKQRSEVGNILENWQDFLLNYKRYSYYSSIRKFAIEEEASKQRLDSDPKDGYDDLSMKDENIEEQNDQNESVEDGISKLDKQYGDIAANDESPISKAEQSLIDYLMSVPKVKTIDENTGELTLKKNDLGYEVGSDPYELFYSIKRTLSGAYNLETFLNRLSDPALHLRVPEAKIIAEDIKKIISNLTTDSPTSTKNINRLIEEFTFLQSFQGALNLPEVMNTQLTVDYYSAKKDKDSPMIKKESDRIVNYDVLTRTLTQRIINRWKKKFEDPRSSIMEDGKNLYKKKIHFTSANFGDQNFDLYNYNNTIYISDEGNVHLNIFAFNEENKAAFLGNSIIDIQKFFSIFSINFDERVFNDGKNIEELKKVRDEILVSLIDIEKVATEKFYSWLDILISNNYKTRKDEIVDILSELDTTDKRSLIQGILTSNIVSPSDINMILTREGISGQKVSLRSADVPGFTTSPIALLSLKNHSYNVKMEVETGEFETVKGKSITYNISKPDYIGEIIGSPYEIKEDGVYYIQGYYGSIDTDRKLYGPGVKLENPENKSEKDLIEEHIKKTFENIETIQYDYTDNNGTKVSGEMTKSYQLLTVTRHFSYKEKEPFFKFIKELQDSPDLRTNITNLFNVSSIEELEKLFQAGDIKYNGTTGNLTRTETKPTRVRKRKIVNKEFVIKNHFYNIRDIADMQAEYGDDITSGSFRIDDRTKYPYYNTTQLLLVSNLLNQIENRSEIKNDPHLLHIDPSLPWLRKNLFYNSLFKIDGSRMEVKGRRTDIIVEDIASFKVIDIVEVEGEEVRKYTERKISQLSAREKKFVDVLTLLKSGAIEIRRAETSPSMMSVRLTNYLGKDYHLPISPADIASTSTSNIMSNNKISEYMQNLFVSELQKMFWYKQKYGNNLQKFSEQLNIFEDILPKELINKIKTAAEDLLDGSNKLEKLNEIFLDKNKDLQREFIDSVNKYFEGEIDSFYKDLVKFTPREKEAITSIIGSGTLSPVASLFIVNRFILRSEFDSLIFGDLYHYSNPFKRGKNVTNHGFPLYVDQVRNIVLNKLNKTTLHSLSQNKLVADTKDYRILNTSVLQDVEMQSLYFSSGRMFKNIDRVREALGIPKMTQFEKDKFNPYSIQKDKGFTGIKATDGQGIIGLDFYRALCQICKIWTPEMQNEYNRQLAFFRYNEHKRNNYKYLNVDGSEMQGQQLEDAIASDLDLIKHKPFAEFTPLKISYTGPLREEGRPLTPIYDKFSVRAILPEHAYGRRDENLMREMIKKDIDYVKFESGSKVFKQDPITWIKKQTKKVVNPISKELETVEEYDLTNFDVKIEDNNVQKLISGFLKHQLGTFDDSFVNIYGSQFRKIFYDSAFKIALLTKNERLFKKLLASHDRVKILSDRLIRIQENDLFNILGIEKESVGFDPNNKELFKYNVVDFEKFIKVLKEEGLRQDFTINGIDYLEYDPKTKKAKWDLDFAFNRKEIQDLLSGMIDKRLRRLKLNGRSLIQVSGIGWEKASDYFSRPTDEQLAQYGSNDLPFYDIEDDNEGNPIRTTKMGVKIPLIGEFQNLLNVNYPGTNEKIRVDYINKDGKRVLDYDASVTRLNEAIRNPEWKQKYIKQLTLVGYRIPTSNTSFIDHMEVMEFLPSSAGNIIIAPMEQIIKSGSDFDIDNMKMIFPSIAKDGSFITEKILDGITDEEIFSEIRKLSLTEQEIRDLKRSLRDKLNLSKEDLKNLSDKKYLLSTNIVQYINSLSEKLGVDIIDQALYNYYSKKLKDPADPKSIDIINQNIQKARKTIEQNVIFDETKVNIVDIIIKQLKSTRFGDISFEEYESEFLEKEPGDISHEAIQADEYYRILKEIETLEVEKGISLDERSNYGINLEIFRKRDMIVKAITNSILTEYSETLSEPLYYENLITPTSQDMVNSVANDMIIIINNYTPDQLLSMGKNLFDMKSSNISNMSHMKEYEMWDFIMGKRKDLGGWAIHRTYSSVFNYINFTLNKQFTDYYGNKKITYTPLIPRNRRNEFVSEDGDIKMHGLDLNGNFIGDVLDQLVSATIDLVNSPAYPHLGINKHNKKVASYLIHQGIPLKEVVFFLNQPILKDLYDLFETNSSLIQGYTLKHAMVQLAQKNGMLSFIEGYRSQWNENLPKYEIYETTRVETMVEDQKVTEYRKNLEVANPYLLRPYSDFNDYIKEDDEFTLEQLESELKKGKESDRNFQKSILAYFGSIQEEVSSLSDLQFSYNTDTTKYGTIQSIIKNLDRKEILKTNDIFKKQQIIKLEENSMISPFDYTERAKDILIQLFPTLYSDKRGASNLQIFKEILKSTFGKNEYIEKVSKTIDNDFIEYIYKNFGKYNGTNFTEYFLPKIKNSEDSTEFFAIKFNNIIKKYPEIRDNVLFVSRLSDEAYKLSVTDFTKILQDKKGYSPLTRIWNIYLERDSENSVVQRNRFIMEWRNLINFNPIDLGLEQDYTIEEAKEISDFFRELAYFSLYQSGATNIGNNFSDLIPVEIWTDFITESAEEMKKYFSYRPELYGKFLKSFSILFKENNPKNIKWNSVTYTDGTIDPKTSQEKKIPYAFDFLYYKGKDYYIMQDLRLDSNPFKYLKENCK
jgi:hypothetical protein